MVCVLYVRYTRNGNQTGFSIKRANCSKCSSKKKVCYLQEIYLFFSYSVNIYYSPQIPKKYQKKNPNKTYISPSFSFSTLLYRCQKLTPFRHFLLSLLSLLNHPYLIHRTSFLFIKARRIFRGGFSAWYLKLILKA